MFSDGFFFFLIRVGIDLSDESPVTLKSLVFIYHNYGLYVILYFTYFLGGFLLIY